MTKDGAGSADHGGNAMPSRSGAMKIRARGVASKENETIRRSENVYGWFRNVDEIAKRERSRAFAERFRRLANNVRTVERV